MSQVVVLKCEDYDIEKVYSVISKGLEMLGGIESIIPVDKKVLLKPNLVVPILKEAAATTHPIIMEAIIMILIEKGYSVKYGDSPGYGSPLKAAKKAGLKDVADKYEIELADFVNGEKIAYPEGKIAKQFDIANAILETDAIINLPKMKSHALQRITGAIKNPFGAVIGFNKGAMHGRFNNAYNFAEMIIDLNNYLKVNLHIMDGIIAMEGNGPRNGDPVKMNVILLSTDPVALDTVFCKLVNVDYKKIPLITYGQEYGLGFYDDLEILGDDIEDLINLKFKVERTTIKHIEKTKFTLLRKYVVKKPYIISNLCKKCGVCVEVCPVKGKAVNWKEGNKTIPPVYDYDKCIRCYCCQEMCPHKAIDVKTPPIGKIIYGLKLMN